MKSTVFVFFLIDFIVCLDIIGIGFLRFEILKKFLKYL